MVLPRQEAVLPVLEIDRLVVVIFDFRPVRGCQMNQKRWLIVSGEIAVGMVTAGSTNDILWLRTKKQLKLCGAVLQHKPHNEEKRLWLWVLSCAGNASLFFLLSQYLQKGPYRVATLNNSKIWRLQSFSFTKSPQNYLKQILSCSLRHNHSKEVDDMTQRPDGQYIGKTDQ